MPKDDTQPRIPDTDTNGTSSKTKPHPPQTSKDGSYGFFKLPEPIKQIFDKFPLRTYSANELPRRAKRRKQDQNALYIFTTPESAREDRPSFNPGCLKWQTYLRLRGIRHITVPSNNHASPTGALPFLLPDYSSAAISASKLPNWVSTQTSSGDSPSHTREDAYLSLLSHRIRPCWLHALYLSPRNFADVAKPLYIDSCTSSPIVQTVLSSQLQSAAFEEILKLSPSLTQTTMTSAEVNTLYTEARLAFSALSTLLDENEWFFGRDRPGLFDASVFAYTYLTLDLEELMGWKDRRLTETLEGFDNLRAHCKRISERYYA